MTKEKNVIVYTGDCAKKTAKKMGLKHGAPYIMKSDEWGWICFSNKKQFLLLLKTGFLWDGDDLAQMEL